MKKNNNLRATPITKKFKLAMLGHGILLTNSSIVEYSNRSTLFARQDHRNGGRGGGGGGVAPGHAPAPGHAQAEASGRPPSPGPKRRRRKEEEEEEEEEGGETLV